MRPKGLGVSIERLFRSLAGELAKNVDLEVMTLPFPKVGPVQMIANLYAARKRKGEVHHVTGDCHYVVLALPRKRTILTVHDCVSLHRCRGIKQFLLLWFWYKLPVRWAEVVVAISSATREELLSYVPEAQNKVKVIRNCIPDEYKPFPKSFNATRPVILQVGTSYNKNLMRVAAALEGISCHWRIIGRINPEQKQTIESYGIDFSNAYDLSDEQMLKEYRMCDVLVFASTYEGFGMPIVEAQAVGRPVVTSNQEPMSSIAGRSACLVNPLETSSIRNGLKIILTNATMREAFIAAGYQNAIQYSSARMADEYIALYQLVQSRAGMQP